MPDLPEGHRAPEDRVDRTCDSCKASDNHAHHIMYVGTTQHPVTGEEIDLSISKHVQCCAADGCEICQTDLEHAEKAGVPNHTTPSDAFNQYMQSKTSEHLQALAERHGIESPSFTRQSDPAVAAAEDELRAAQKRYNQLVGAPSPEEGA